MVKFSENIDTQIIDISPEEKKEKKDTYREIRLNQSHNFYMRAQEKARDVSMWDVYHVGKPKPVPPPLPPPLTKKMRPNIHFDLVQADPLLIVDAEPALTLPVELVSVLPIPCCEMYCLPQLARSENDELPFLDPKTMTRREIIDYIFKEGYPDFIADNYPNFTKENRSYKSKSHLMKHTTIKELYMLYDDIINDTHIYC